METPIGDASLDLLDYVSLFCLVGIFLSAVLACMGHHARKNGYVRR